MWNKSFRGPEEADNILKSEGRGKGWQKPRGRVPKYTHAIVLLALLILE